MDYPLVVEHCSLPDGIDLQRAHLRWLSLAGTQLGTCDGAALTINAAGLQVDDDVVLRDGFLAHGLVDFTSATIGGDLDCVGGSFLNRDRSALTADGLIVKGSVYLEDDCIVDGGLRLPDAHIDGNLVCDGGHFLNPGGDAINAERSIIRGGVYVRDGVQIKGWVSFAAASVRAMFHWYGVTNPKDCSLDLQSATVGTLWDSVASWPDTIDLDGLVYDRLFNQAPMDTHDRLVWLRREEKRRFLPQPYQQLAKVLKEMGHEVTAREILIEMNEDPARLAALAPIPWLWHRLLGWTIGYGYRSWQALLWLAAFFLAGCVLFGLEAKAGKLDTTGTDKVPQLCIVVYALDTLVPIIDLDQAKHWRPSRLPVRIYWWGHTVMGWFFTTLFAVGVSGLIRN